SSIRCAGASRPGRGSASTSSMSRRSCGRARGSSIPTIRRLRRGLRLRGENLLQGEGARDLELIVAAIGGILVGPPAQEGGAVAEAVAFHVVVLHFTHPLDPQRLPRQVLPLAPAALASGHPAGGLRLGPAAPGMLVERILAQRC